MADDAIVLQPGAGRAIDLGGFTMTIKASPEVTDGRFSLLEAEEPPNFGPPMHIHRDAAEAFYILDGEYLIFIEDRATRCPQGSFVYIPAGVVHGFRVASSSSRKLNLYIPAAMIGYFDELAELTASGPGNEERLAGIAERYGMQVVGPVPEGYM